MLARTFQTADAPRAPGATPGGGSTRSSPTRPDIDISPGSPRTHSFPPLPFLALSCPQVRSPRATGRLAPQAGCYTRAHARARSKSTGSATTRRRRCETMTVRRRRPRRRREQRHAAFDGRRPATQRQVSDPPTVESRARGRAERGDERGLRVVRRGEARVPRRPGARRALAEDGQERAAAPRRPPRRTPPTPSPRRRRRSTARCRLGAAGPPARRRRRCAPPPAGGARGPGPGLVAPVSPRRVRSARPPPPTAGQGSAGCESALQPPAGRGAA